MSKKNVPSIFLTCKYVFLNIWKKNISKKIVPGIFRLVSMLFEIFEKGYEEKNIPGVFRLVSILFQIFVKGYEQKHFPRYFPIRKYDFLNI